MLKQKIAGLGLSLLMLFSATGAVVAGAPLFARAETAEQEPAEQTVTALDTSNAELFLPAHYEQYLALERPSYMAMNDEYLAIADGTKLYLYDKADEAYTYYQTQLPNSVPLEKIQFSDGGRLFFSADGLLYEYSFTENAATRIPAIPCATFLVEGDYLYAVRMGEQSVSLNRYSLNDLSSNGEYTGDEYNINTVVSSIRPKLTSMNGHLYCVRNNEEVYCYDITLPEPVCTDSFKLDKSILDQQISNLQFVCAYGDHLYYTANGNFPNYTNGLYRTDFEGNAEMLIAGDGFSAVAAYGENLYCIRNSSVLGLELTENGVDYSGYEIAAASASNNRLWDAADVVRAGNLLVIADQRNRRVSVYNYETGEYSNITSSDPYFSPSLVATDGETIACASGANVYVCKYGDAEFGEPQESAQFDIKGVACVYGSVYYVTGNKLYGKVGGGAPVGHDYDVPARLTRDLYGNLFVSYQDGTVYSFTEQTFLEKNKGVELSLTLPANHTSLRSDFEGNLYCLSGNAVYKNGEKFAEIDGTDYVYEGVENPVSFALGFEDSEVYFLFGNYAVRSRADALEIPTLDKILTESAKTDAFGEHGAERLIVDIPAGEIGIRTDLSALKTEESPYFPYAGYYRLSENNRGILLAETDKHFLVLTGDKFAYTAALFRRNESCIVAQEEYWTAANGSESNAYLSSDVFSYYVPTLSQELTDTQLARGSRITVLGFVQTPERTYARIEYEGTARARNTGYVPESFLTQVSPFPVSGDDFVAAYLKANEAGVVFTAANGETLTVTERTAARFREQEDGSYLAQFTRDGVSYSAYVDQDAIDFGNSDALRISLIIILTVLALVIIGAYVYLLPRKRAHDEQFRENTAKKDKK